MRIQARLLGLCVVALFAAAAARAQVSSSALQTTLAASPFNISNGTYCGLVDGGESALIYQDSNSPNGTPTCAAFWGIMGSGYPNILLGEDEDSDETVGLDALTGTGYFMGLVTAAGFNAGYQKIVHVANGTVDTDAATFGQLPSSIAAVSGQYLTGYNTTTHTFSSAAVSIPSDLVTTDTTQTISGQKSFSGNVGIGTTSPGAPLGVVGDSGTTQTVVAYVKNGHTGASTGFDSAGESSVVGTWTNGSQIVEFSPALGGNGVVSSYTGSLLFQTAGRVNRMAITSDGNVGIGTNTPAGILTVASPAADGAGNINQGLLFVDTLNGAADSWSHAAIYSVGSSGYNGSLAFATDGDGLENNNPTEKMRILYNGNVGVGTATPGAKLEVDGSVKLTAGSGASMTFADGTIQTTAWNGVLSGGDYAESVAVIGDRKQYEPGDVMLIDPSSPDKFLKSSEPYSTMVAGIYSTKPGLTGRHQQNLDPSWRQTEVPMAMMGIVPAKVSAENGAIKPGDLLVASSTAGYAMKGTDRERLAGAVIGKAMGHLDSGLGMIQVLVSLQ